MYQELATIFFLALSGLAFMLPMGSLQIFGNQRKNLYIFHADDAKHMARPKEWDNLFTAWSAAVASLVSLCGIQMQLIDPNPPKLQRAILAITTIILTVLTISSITLVHRMEHASYGNDFSSDIDVKTNSGPGTWLLFGVSFATLFTGIIGALPSRKKVI